VSADRYPPRSPDDVRRLLLDHPFAWLASAADGDLRATALPVRPVFGPDGAVTTLIGHFARSNPQGELLRRQPRALILVLGPHGYISPSWLTDRAQAPTWNYASAQFLVELELFDDEAGLEILLRDLIGAMEAGRERPWRQEEMGPRYARVARGIIGFRARVLEARPRFKLGQDERADVFPEILAGLARDGAEELTAWMKAFDERGG
jgi:transcriptional regulator